MSFIIKSIYYFSILILLYCRERMTMPIITEQMLDKLLNTTHNNGGTSFNVNHHSQGPSYLDTWLRFIEGREDCWQQRAATLVTSQKKKIIFSNAILREREPESLDLAFMSALIEYYDVYLWPGSDTALATEPLSCSAEFWEWLNSCHPDTQHSVAEGCAQQGIATDGYIILDHPAYNTLLQECKISILNKSEKINVASVLDLTQLGSLTLEQIKTVVDVSHIKTIKILAPTTNELHDLLQLPHLETVVIKKPSLIKHWSENCLEKLVGYGLNLELQEVMSSKQLEIPTIFKKINIIDAQDVVVLKFVDDSRLRSNADDNTLEDLEICQCKDLSEVDIKSCKKLKRLKLNFSDKFTKLSVAQLQDLEELEISKFVDSYDWTTQKFSADLSELKIDSYHKLKRLRIDNVQDLKEIDFSRLQELEELEILKCGSLNVSNLKECKKLKRLRISCKNIKEINFSCLKNLENLEIYDYNGPFSLDLRGCQQLIKLSFYNVNLEMIDLSGLQELQELDIISCDNVDVLNTEEYSKLKKLKIDNVKNLAVVNCSRTPNLEELEVKTCQDFPVLCIENLQKLTSLKVMEENFKKIDFSSLQNLEILEILNCNNLSALDLENCRKFCLKLKSLMLTNSNIEEIDPSQFQSLKELVFSNCSGLLNLQGCQKLKRLEISNSSNLKDIDLSQLQNLESLIINNCSVQILNLENYRKLKHLKINSANNLSEIDISQLRNLEELEIDNCRELHILNLENCRNLKLLTINHCNVELQKTNLDFCSKLESLEISGMPSVNEIDFSQLPKLKKIKINCLSAIDVNLNNASELRNLNIAAPRVSLQLANCTKLRTCNLNAPENASVKHLEDCVQLRLFAGRVPTESFVQFTDCLPEDCQHRLQKSNSDFNFQDFQEVQYQQSKTSPVAIFSLKADVVGVDADTASKQHHASGELSVTLEAANKVSSHNYRTIIHDQVKMKISGKIRFTSQKSNNAFTNTSIPISSFTDHDIVSLRNAVASDHKSVLAFFTGQLEPGKCYPLTTLQTMSNHEITVYCNPQNAVKLFWHPAHQQYYVQLRTKFLHKKRKVEVLYCFKENPDYEKEASGPPIVQRCRDLLPTKLIKALQPLRSDPKLSFLFDDNKDITEKTRLLIDYCHFEDEPLTTCAKDASDIEKLLCTIQERKGVCRHSSKAFMLLARCFLGIPVQIVFNELHAFAEIPYPSQRAGENQWYWRRVDLGGGFVSDLTPAVLRQNKFQTISQTMLQEAKPSTEYASMPAKKPAEKSETLNSANVIEQRLQKQGQPQELSYYREFIALAQKNELQSVISLIEEKRLPPLIELAPDQDPLRVNTWLRRQLKTHPIDLHARYLYINHPKDFALFLESYQLAAGQRCKVKGPLGDLIRNGGIVVVNWSNFTATEIASYKSILDAEPTLLGQPVSKQVRVIGLTKSTTESCAAFLSRCQHYTLPPDFLKIQPLATEYFTASTCNNPKPQEIEEIDLFHCLNWREKLLGKITFKGDQILLEDGVLVRAIQQKRSLLIHNPPDDDDFKLLTYRVNAEHQLLYNGELLKVPDGVTIQTDVKVHDNELPNVTIHMESKTTKDNRQRIYLGLYNLHECFEQLVFNKIKQAEIVPGFLEKHDPEQHDFYLTESMPQSDWQVLLADIKQHYPQKSFHFILAPGVTIQRVAENKAVPSSTLIKAGMQLSDIPAVIVSNDADHLCAQLAEQAKNEDNKTAIFYLQPESSYSDMIAEMKIIEQRDHSKVEFSYQEKAVLQALNAGETVILNGALSVAFYQQLLPLLSAYPHIQNNGQRMDVNGRLMLVLPDTAAKKLPLLQYGKCNYTFENYRAAFSADNIYLNKIEKFYHWASKLPHRGPGCPTTPLLSYKRVENMLRVLKRTKLHPHNPIKGLFHYDYFKDGKDYAYLNVIAKYSFSELDQIPYRGEKLKRLMARYPIETMADCKGHAWQILNCLSGTTLVDCLHDLNEAIDGHATYPTLTQAALLKLWKTVQKLQQQPCVEKKSKSHVEKRNEQLCALLEEDNTFLIILKGPPGVGKTYTVRQLKEDIGFDCHEDILKWLEGNSEKTSVLLLDEANMAIPGTWDFLKGLSTDQRTVYYQNKQYTLTAHHKIIVTGNPEHYPGRYYQPFFQQYGETLNYVMPNDDYLKEFILRAYLGPKNLFVPEYANAMLTAYHLIQAYNPTHVYSNRALENLAQRFIILADKKNEEKAIVEALWHAAIGEFMGSIQEHEKRTRFIVELANKLGVDSKSYEDSNPDDLIMVSEHCRIPKEKAYLITGIEQDLQLREMAISQDSQALENAKKNNVDPQIVNRFYYKQGVLVEGDPGIGKSTLLKALLAKNEFSKNAENSQKKYYEITVGDEDKVAEILIKAYHGGSAVILDELNLSESIEQLLDQLLTGRYQAGIKPEKPGFMVFASQNPGYLAGRKSVSKPLQDRLHIYYFDPYSREALINIARDANVPGPEAFVAAYEKCQKDCKINMRTFYTLLSSYSQQKIPSQKDITDVIQVDKIFYNSPHLSTAKQRLANQGYANFKPILINPIF
jgi:MoxR-like ATPase